MFGYPCGKHIKKCKESETKKPIRFPVVVVVIIVVVVLEKEIVYKHIQIYFVHNTIHIHMQKTTYLI